MLFIELDEGEKTLADIERICQDIVNNNNLSAYLEQEKYNDLLTILKPTLAFDHNEEEKRQHWKHLLENFTLKDSRGVELRFYREPITGKLYFGNQAGFDMVNQMVKDSKQKQS